MATPTATVLDQLNAAAWREARTAEAAGDQLGAARANRRVAAYRQAAGDLRRQAWQAQAERRAA